MPSHKRRLSLVDGLILHISICEEKDTRSFAYKMSFALSVLAVLGHLSQGERQGNTRLFDNRLIFAIS